MKPFYEADQISLGAYRGYFTLLFPVHPVRDGGSEETAGFCGDPALDNQGRDGVCIPFPSGAHPSSGCKEETPGRNMAESPSPRAPVPEVKPALMGNTEPKAEPAPGGLRRQHGVPQTGAPTAGRVVAALASRPLIPEAGAGGRAVRARKLLVGKAIVRATPQRMTSTRQPGFRFRGTLRAPGRVTRKLQVRDSEPGRRGWRWAGPRFHPLAAGPFRPLHGHFRPQRFRPLVPLGHPDSRGLCHIQRLTYVKEKLCVEPQVPNAGEFPRQQLEHSCSDT